MKFVSDPSHYAPGKDSGAMDPIKLSDANGKAPQCEFIHPGEKRRKFRYCYSPTDDSHRKWQDNNIIDGYNSESGNPEISTYDFKIWNCSIGGLSYSLRENEHIDINTFNLTCPPIITMTAYWQRAYDVIKFTIGEDTYCEVCINVNVNRVVYPPHDPEIKNNDEDEEWKFYGWNYSEGDYLPGVDRSSMVICGENDTPIFC